MKKIRPEIFFPALILIFGIFNVFNTPLGAGNDEDTHIARIWEMSRGTLIPNQYLSLGENFPSSFRDLSYRHPRILTPISLDEWLRQFSIQLDREVQVLHVTRAAYFPTLYLPQAFIMGITERIFDFPVAITYYLLRFSYLVMYVLMIYAVLRIIPLGKWVMGVLAVAPMNLILSTTISPDPVINSMCFLFIAWILKLSVESESQFSIRRLIVTALMVVGICTLKPNCIVLLLLIFLIPRNHFGSRKKLWLFAAFVVMSVIVVYGGWNLLVPQPNPAHSANAIKLLQFKNIFLDPIRFVTIIFSNIFQETPRYFSEWVGVTGYRYWKMPDFIYWLYPILLIFTFAGEKSSPSIKWKQRLWMVIVAVLFILFTITIFYIIQTQPDSTTITGTWGRYFIGAIPLFFLALHPVKELHLKLMPWTPAGSILVAFLATLSLFLVYHFPCGNYYYTRGLCYLPRFRNWDPASSLSLKLTGDSSARQTITPRCSSLTEAAVWINDRSASGSAPLSMKLIDPQTGTIVAEKTIGFSDIPSSGWLEMEFSPIPASADKLYRLEVHAIGFEDQQWIELAYTDSAEYPDGELLRSDPKLKDDLLFRYGCLTGLEAALSK